jgi:hypothetical protein
VQHIEGAVRVSVAALRPKPVRVEALLDAGASLPEDISAGTEAVREVLRAASAHR